MGDVHTAPAEVKGPPLVLGTYTHPPVVPCGTRTRTRIRARTRVRARTRRLKGPGKLFEVQHCCIHLPVPFSRFGLLEGTVPLVGQVPVPLAGWPKRSFSSTTPIHQFRDRGHAIRLTSIHQFLHVRHVMRRTSIHQFFCVGPSPCSQRLPSIHQFCNVGPRHAVCHNRASCRIECAASTTTHASA